MRRVMKKYIKPETIVIKVVIPLFILGSPIEEGKLDPSKDKGTSDEGNIVMAKRHPYGFDESLDTGWNTDDDDIW